jgi:chemotaxis protein histidine kinase CheA
LPPIRDNSLIFKRTIAEARLRPELAVAKEPLHPDESRKMAEGGKFQKTITTSKAMKPLTHWIAPCLVLSIYFGDFAKLNADTPGEGKNKEKEVAEGRGGKGGGGPAAPARPAPAPQAAPKRAAPEPQRAAQPKEAPAPQVAKREAAPERPKVAPKPEPAPQRAPAAPQKVADNHAAEQAAAARAQAQRAEANKQSGKDRGEAARDGAAAKEAQAAAGQRAASERAAAAETARMKEAKGAQADRQEQAAGNAAKQREAAQDRAKEAQGDRQEKAGENAANQREVLQQRAKEAQDRAKQAQGDRQEKAGENAANQREVLQQRAKEAQDRAKQAQGDRQEKAGENAANQREALQQRAAENQARAKDNQERVRENVQDNQNRVRENQERVRDNVQERVADNQARLRDAQERARQAQADLRSRVSDNVEQRRAAYQNVRQLAAEARRPILERPDTIFRPEYSTARSNPSWQKRWAGWGVGAVVAGGAAEIALSNNYERAVNWSYQPSSWGGRPWWTSNRNHDWYTGSWNYGWNRNWSRRNSWYAPQPWSGYDTGVATGIGWGLAAWGLGNVIYDTGYEVYSNPYAPASYVYGDTTIDYSQPFTEFASQYPTGDAKHSKTASEKSTAALQRSRAAFREEDYTTALKAVDESISFVPGDSSLHEYRALILFALGRYGDSAGVLNSVLASGPGWDWKTMIAFYGDQKTYDGQLARLEDYAHGKRDAVDARFVLGYHYMVAGNLDGAGREFDEVVSLQPRDTVAKQLRDLVRSSVKDPQASEPVGNTERSDTDMVEPERLVGNWRTDRGSAGTVSLSLQDNGQFAWNFDRQGGKATNLKGTYSIDDRGLLVLKSDSSQMVGEIHMPSDGQLVFVLAGGPEGDPGLNFTRN